MKDSNKKFKISSVIAAILAISLIVIVGADLFTAIKAIRDPSSGRSDTITDSESVSDAQANNGQNGSGSAQKPDESSSGDESSTGDNVDASSDASSGSEATVSPEDSSSEGESSESSEPNDGEQDYDIPTPVFSDEVNARLASMSLEDKVYQMFIVRPEALTDGQVGLVTASGDIIRNGVLNKPVGGVIYFGENIEDPEQTKDMTESILNYSFSSGSGIGMFICTDEEGGVVSRVAKNPNFGLVNPPSMAYVQSDGEAYEIGANIASYLHDYGFNVDFAPVADVNISPENELGDRIFSSDASVVAGRVASVVNGIHSSHTVLSSLKHFPGLGAETGNTHYDSFTRVERTFEQLRNEEFVAFQGGIDAGADFVMVGHHIMSCAGDDLPSDLSHVVCTDWIRGELGFQGLVITDSQEMGTIVNVYSSGDAAVKSIQAGIDIVLMPKNLNEAVQAVITAVNNGTITEERIDESVGRILSKKAEIGLL